MEVTRIKLPGRLNLLIVALTQFLAFTLLWLGSRLDLVWSIPIGIVFSFVLLTNYALMHESVHHVLHKSSKLNYIFGVLTHSLFPKSYTMFEIAHRMHHRGNRTDHELFDYYYPNDDTIKKNIQWYGILTGIYYPLVPLGNLLMAIAPSIFQTRPFKQSAFSSILFEEFKGRTITKIRLEVLFTIMLWVVMWQLLSLQWQSVLVLYACFGFNWATRQYVTHAWTPRNVIEGATNLEVSRIHGWILLNGQWDHAHHKFPYLPWSELSNPQYHMVEQKGYFKQWLSLWKGMRPNFESAPAVIDEKEYFVEVKYF
jgi:fatty acid desaturase